MIILNLVKFQLVKIFSSCRFWIGIALLSFIVLNVNSNVPQFCDSLGLKITPWSMPFILATNIPTTIGIVAVMILCDAPFTDSNELFCLMRVNRTKWFISRMIYIISISVIIPLIFFILTVISFLPNIIFVNDWGDFYYFLAQGGAMQSEKYIFLHIDYNILISYAPLQATLVSGSLLSLGIFTLGNMIFAVNIFSNRIFGATIACFSCFLISLNSGIPQLSGLSKFSPMIWCNLKNSYMSQINDIVIGALMFNFVLIILSYLKFRKADINILESI